MNAFAAAFQAASNGPVAEGDLISIRRNARLRVTYNWLYSALNVDPNDSSPFPWLLSKIDDTRISLSPKNGYAGKTLYASVRPDYNYTVQVQAPFSADWITGVGADEIIGMSSPGLQILTLQGLNRQFIAVDESPVSHGPHTGYLLHSNGSPHPDAYSWFFGITQVLQPNLHIKTVDQLTAGDIREALTAAGLESGDANVTALQELLS
jgi:hypothetical protein